MFSIFEPFQKAYFLWPLVLVQLGHLMILFPQNHQLYTVPQWPARFKLSVDSFAEHFWCGERWTPQCSACPVQFRSTSWNYFNSHVFQVDFWTVPQSGELRIQSQKLELGTLTKNVYRFSACMSWDAELLFFVTTYQYKLWDVAISIWGSSKNLPAEVMHKDNFSTPLQLSKSCDRYSMIFQKLLRRCTSGFFECFAGGHDAR